MHETKKLLVTDSITAKTLGSGTLDVLGSPALMINAENMAMEMSVSLYQPEEQTTVGTHFSMDHLGPTAIGSDITMSMTLVEKRNKQLFFEFKVMDDDTLIAQGNHTRVIINIRRFMEKLK